MFCNPPVNTHFLILKNGFLPTETKEPSRGSAVALALGSAHPPPLAHVPTPSRGLPGVWLFPLKSTSSSKG